MEPTSEDRNSDDPAEWLRLWQSNGDREALGRLLEWEIVALKARLRGRWDPRTTPDFGASDAAQEAVARLLRLDVPPSFDTPQKLRAYLWTAAWRLLIERLRKRTDVRLDDATPSELNGSFEISGGQSEVERSDRATSLQVVFNLLEPDEQQILDLVVGKNLGIEGAADVLGITARMAQTRCEKARTRLAHKLRGWSELIG